MTNHKIGAVYRAILDGHEVNALRFEGGWMTTTGDGDYDLVFDDAFTLTNVRRLAAVDPEDAPQMGRVWGNFYNTYTGSGESDLAIALRAERDRQHAPGPRYYVERNGLNAHLIRDRKQGGEIVLSVSARDDAESSKRIARAEAARLNGGEDA